MKSLNFTGFIWTGESSEFEYIEKIHITEEELGNKIFLLHMIDVFG